MSIWQHVTPRIVAAGPRETWLLPDGRFFIGSAAEARKLFLVYGHITCVKAGRGGEAAGFKFGLLSGASMRPGDAAWPAGPMDGAGPSGKWAEL
jgi:hypothetical protein